VIPVVGNSGGINIGPTGFQTDGVEYQHHGQGTRCIGAGAGPGCLAGNRPPSSAWRESGGVGDGGEINIQAGRSANDGAQLQTLVSRASEDGTPAGRGNVGNVNIDVS